MNLRPTAIAACITIVCAGMVACGRSATPLPGNGLPARPATLRIEGIDPCTLLKPEQYAQLGVDAGHRRDYASEMPMQGTVCDWSTVQPRDRISYSVALVTNRGAESALGAEPLRAVGGYAAAPTSSAIGNRQYECLLFVDIAPGRSMLAHYTNDSEDLPGMTHQRACDNAQAAAEFMLANLRAAQPGGR